MTPPPRIEDIEVTPEKMAEVKEWGLKLINDKIKEYEEIIKLDNKMQRMNPHLPLERRLIVQHARRGFEDRLEGWKHTRAKFEQMVGYMDRVIADPNDTIAKAFVLKGMHELVDMIKHDTEQLRQVAEKTTKRFGEYYFDINT